MKPQYPELYPVLVQDYLRIGYSISEIFLKESILRPFLIQKYLSIPYDKIGFEEDDEFSSPRFRIYHRDKGYDLGWLNHRGIFTYNLALRFLILDQFGFESLEKSETQYKSLVQAGNDVLRLSILNNFLNHGTLYKLISTLSGDQPLWTSSVFRNFKRSVGLNIQITPPLQEITNRYDSLHSKGVEIEYNENERLIVIEKHGKTLAIISGCDFDLLEDDTPKQFRGGDLFKKWVVYLFDSKGFFR